MFGWSRASGKTGESKPEESKDGTVSVPTIRSDSAKEAETKINESGAQTLYSNEDYKEEVVVAGAGAEEEEREGRRIELHIPDRYMILPSLCTIMGMSLGLMRGSRAEGMRFLAENAHRPPTTMQGWYFYKKTKNYRMMWGGLKAGGRDALKLGSVGLTWAALEDGLERVGQQKFQGSEYVSEFREVGAGLGTALLFSSVCEWNVVQKLFIGD